MHTLKRLMWFMSWARRCFIKPNTQKLYCHISGILLYSIWMIRSLSVKSCVFNVITPQIMNLNSLRLNMMTCYQIWGAFILFVVSLNHYPVLLNATFWMQTGINSSGPLPLLQIKPCDTVNLVTFREQNKTNNKIYTCTRLYTCLKHIF